MIFEDIKTALTGISIPVRNGDDDVDVFYDDAVYYRTLKPEIEPKGPGHADLNKERAALTITANIKTNIENYLREVIKALSIKRIGKQWFIKPNFTKVKLFDKIYQKTVLLEELYLG